MYVCMYVCMVITYSKGKDQPSEVAVRGFEFEAFTVFRSAAQSLVK